MALRRASRVPTDLRGSGWYEILPPSVVPPKRLEGGHTADWAIVGAGFAGLAAARRLSQLRPRDRIVVLDAQRVGWGAAGRNSGFMIDLPHELNSDNYAGGRDEDLNQIAMNRAGIDFAAEAAEEYGLSDSFARCGKYHGAATGRGLKALQAFEAHLDALGEPYTTLDAAQMKEIVGTGFYLGGAFTPGAAMIQPAAYIRGVAEGLARHVEIYEESPVTAIESNGSSHMLTCPSGRISAPRVLMTNNGHLESFGFFRHRLVHVFTYASMTRPLTRGEALRLGGQSSWGLIPADPMGSTVRRIAGDRIVMRNTFTYNPGMTTSARQIARIGRAHDRSFKARFPMLSGVGMEYRWGGHLCLSLNSVPVFGEIAEGIYAACCCNGLGTVKGTFHGKLIAELAAGDTGPLVDAAVAGPAPRRLYPEPFMTLGAKARLWWMQHRAGREL